MGDHKPQFKLLYRGLVSHILATETYPTKKSEKSEYSNALADSRIPGAGGCVYAALDILTLAVRDLYTPEQMIEACDLTWRRHRTCDHPHAMLPGVEQATLLEPYFLEIAN